MQPLPHVTDDVAISACSLLTPLDDAPHLPGTWDALCAGRSVHQQSVPDALLAGTAELDRSIRLVLAAVNRLPADLHGAHLFCGTSKGPITTFLAAAENLRHHLPLTAMQAQHIALGVGAMGALLHGHLPTEGPPHTSVAACASGLHALHRAALAIRHGECARALVVAADASLHPLFDASFQRLGVLSARDPAGHLRCEPFGKTGDGFFLIEAAAALLLESPRALTRHPLAWLERSWIGADSTALLAIDPHTHTHRTGHRACMPSDPLAFLHAHATGTAHDAHELAALHAVVGADVPTFSHKQWLGHSLGAAGLVSIALSALSHHPQRTPDHTPVPPNARSLTIAQGFGGHIALARLRSA
jgi:3-oxoacyl-(acyl-carrier-protein) synthase